MELDSNSEPNVFPRRDDLVGRSCLICTYGTYRESSLVDEIDELVVCFGCGDMTHRWKTKKECWEHFNEKALA